jgi:S-(hydroxymethyl)glutathione dehydrogenase/alcohol dehydrogenase
MQAAIISTPLTPLTVEDIDIDQPIDREVLVRTAVSGVCHSDLHYVDRLSVPDICNR